jgi:FixJ family two-component response regulator
LGSPKAEPGVTFSFAVLCERHEVADADGPRAIGSPDVTAEAARNGHCTTTARSLVSVVDDDVSVRESLPDLLREFGCAARTFASAEEFLASDCVGDTQCLILDVVMPGMTGPALQLELSRRKRVIPIVFITAIRNQSIRPRLLEAGAVECLFKPFSERALLDALGVALRRS